MPAFDVTVAGEINLDLILYGLPDELPPERELLADGMTLTLGGSSAIMAHNLSSLRQPRGISVAHRRRRTGLGALLTLQESGVDISQVRRVPGAVKTGLTVILQREAWRNMVTYSGTIAELVWDDLDLDYLSKSRHFHLSSFYVQRGLRPRVPELFRKMKEAGLTTSLDTNDDPDDGWKGGLDEVLQYVDVFPPVNEREVQKAAGSGRYRSCSEKSSRRSSPWSW